jgi:hypothetical protein
MGEQRYDEDFTSDEFAVELAEWEKEIYETLYSGVQKKTVSPDFTQTQSDLSKATNTYR